MARNNAEDREQAAVFAVLDALTAEYPQCAYVFHVPNGGQRSAITGAQMKRLGVRRGVPDIICPRASQWTGPLAIEMKAARGRLSPEQTEWLGVLHSYGWRVETCYSAGAALLSLAEHLEMNIPRARLQNMTLSAGGSWPDWPMP